MRLQCTDGVIAQFIAWNLSSTDQSFVVVALDDGSLQEWRLKGCRIVEERKTSDAVESAPSASGNTGSPKFLLDIKEQCFLFIQRKYGCNSVSDEMDVAVDVYNFIEQKLRASA